MFEKRKSGYRSVDMETRFQLVDPIVSSFNLFGANPLHTSLGEVEYFYLPSVDFLEFHAFTLNR